MRNRFIGAAGAAVFLMCAGAAPAEAQPTSRLGWISELSGSCWQGRDASGAAVERQCFQSQFGFVRAAVTRGAYQGDSVFGYSRDRMRLEMYAWGTQGEPSILSPVYLDGVYAFEGATENGVATRAVWRRAGDGFEIAEQRRQGGGAWTDAQVVTYTRDGAAPRAFSAGLSQPVLGHGFGWLDRIAGRCYRQIEPERIASNRGCFSYQFENALRQTWYAGEQVTGEAVMFTAPGNEGLRFFYWDARGGFGVGGSVFNGPVLVSLTDTADGYRRILRRRGNGFQITTERETGDPGMPWEYAHHYRYTAQ